MKIIAPIQHNDGASYYRIETPAKYISSDDIHIEFYPFLMNKFKGLVAETRFQPLETFINKVWDQLKQAERYYFYYRCKNEMVWINRSLLSFQNRIDSSIKNFFYDFDDAIWLSGEANHCFEYYCRNAVAVFAGNQFLADSASRYSQRVQVVPTSVDLERYKSTAPNRESFNVGWIGSAAGFYYLLDIEKELLHFFETHKAAKLVIVSEKFPQTLTSLRKYIEYVPWNRTNDVRDINTFSVGIMPLRNSDWDRGKCSLKMLQYMACEIPSVVSAVGMNIEVMSHQAKHGTFGQLVLENNNWCDVLDYYYNLSEASMKSEGKTGREVVANYYSTKKISDTISSYFRNY